jgi:hypothetical protein
MFTRNVDFFAVVVITLGLLAFSKVSSLDWPERGPSLNFQRAIRIQSCPIPDRILSNLAHILNR